MLNEKGEIASAAMANLFWIRKGKLRTPARECGCRAGTVRRWLLERSGHNVEEGSWKADELDTAEEIFLTRFSMGIRMAEIEGHLVRCGVGSGITAASDPEGEYEETRIKARVLTEAMAAYLANRTVRV